MLVWLTPDYFVETDIYIVPELSNYYSVRWIIEYGGNKGSIPFYDLLEKIKKEKNIQIEFIRRPQAHVLDIRYWGYYWKLISKIKCSKPDLIYSAILGVPYIPFCILRIPRKKIVFAAHNVTTPKGVKHYKLTKAYMGLTLSWFKNFQNFSKSQFDLLRREYKNKNNFYAPFVLKDYGKQTNEPGDVITFLSYGRIRGYKCLDVLIEAAQSAKEKCDIPFKVIIAGACDNWNIYQEKIRYPELFDLRIKNVENKDVPNLFGESHYTVLPYQDIAQSGALFVCINYNKPSILSDLPAFTEYITDGYDGLFIKPANVDDLTEKLVYVLENHDAIYPRLTANLSKMKSENFIPEKIIDRYKTYFDSLLCQN